nr:gastrula zinc finger protein XlCGF49.1-like isoform X1 [Onthophagus taurus]
MEMYENSSHSLFEPEITVKQTLDEEGCIYIKQEHDTIIENVRIHPPKTKKQKQQACKVCGKLLSSPSSYYVHMKVHSGSKPFQCTECEATFCRKTYLEVNFKVHMRTHTGERPFQCEYCEKRFTQKSSLNTHKRSHTGERPYSCNVCNRAFAVKNYLIAHRWTHVSDKQLKCVHCCLEFTSRSQYILHSKTHLFDCSHECHFCGRVFAKESYLIRHVHKVHKEERNNDLVTANNVQ